MSWWNVYKPTGKPLFLNSVMCIHNTWVFGTVDKCPSCWAIQIFQDIVVRISTQTTHLWAACCVMFAFNLDSVLLSPHTHLLFKILSLVDQSFMLDFMYNVLIDNKDLYINIDVWSVTSMISLKTLSKTWGL